MIEAHDRLAALVRRTAGLTFEADKQFVVESRLLPLARARGFETASHLVDALIARREPDLLHDVLDALATNETFFFRDRAPFDLFAKVIMPYLLEARRSARSIQIWCTACSTGQEPYSLAMKLDEMAGRLAGWRVDLEASDLSRSAIRVAREGRYNQFEAQRGMPAHLLVRYFQRDGTSWRIAEHIRSRVRLSTFNLLRSFEARGPQDVIFCRNVLIYFDPATKRDILARLAKCLRSDGFLVLGSTEIAPALDGAWACAKDHSTLYVRADGPHAAADPGRARAG